MKPFLLFFCTSVILSSCDKTNKAIVKKLSGSDSAAINFFKGDGTMDSVVKVAIIRDKKQLEQLVTYVSASPAKEEQCGYDGSIHFFKSNMVLQDIDFRMNDAHCMHFQLSMKGERFTTGLSAEARQLLESLKE